MKILLKLKEAKRDMWGDLRYYCPGCGEDICSNGIKGHIIGMAKSEIWEKEFFKKKKTPHLNIVKKFGRIKYKKTLIIEI